MDGDCDDTLTQRSTKPRPRRDPDQRAVTLRGRLGQECGTGDRRWYCRAVLGTGVREWPTGQGRSFVEGTLVGDLPHRPECNSRDEPGTSLRSRLFLGA